MVFNYLIGNMDAHSKNFSLLHPTATNIRLAPFYDIVCTRAYQNIAAKMAMKIGNKYAADHVLPRHWKQLSEEISYRYLAFVNLIETIGHKIKQAAAQKKELHAKGIDHSIINKIIHFVENNIDQTLKRLNELSGVI